jgi:hypothetical protein
MNSNFFLLIGFLIFVVVALNVNAEVFLSNEIKYTIIDLDENINIKVYDVSGVIENKIIDKVGLKDSLDYEVNGNKVEFTVNNVNENDVIADVKGLKYITYDMDFISNCKNCSLINDNGLIKVHFYTEEELKEQADIFIDSKSYVVTVPSLNNSFFNTSLPSFSFTVQNDSLSYECNLIIDDILSGYNDSVTNNTLTTIISNTSLSNAVHYFYINCVNDSINDNSTIFYFTVDTVMPVIVLNLNNPLNNSYVNQNYSLINFSFNDVNFNYYSYKFNNKSVNSSGLVLGFNFNNNSLLGENDTHVYDFSGNGNNGTIINGAVYASGRYGSALSFDGVDDYVDAGNDASLNIIGAFSIELWFKTPTPEKPYMQLVTKDIWINGGYELYFHAADKKLAFLKSSPIQEGYGVTEIQPNLWYHVVVTYDGINYSSIYLNGVDDSLYHNTLSGSITASNEPLFIGKRSDGYFFNGSIDEVRIYNRSLSADEVYFNYVSNLRAVNYTSMEYTSNYSTVSGRVVYNLSVCDKALNCVDSGNYNIFLNVEDYLYPCNYSDYEDLVDELNVNLSGCNGDLLICNNELSNMSDLYNNCSILLNTSNNSLNECLLNLSMCSENLTSNLSECLSNLSVCELNLNSTNLSLIACGLNNTILFNDSLACNSSLSICNLNLSEYAANLTTCESNLTTCLNATCLLSGAGLTDSSFIMLLLIILFIMFLLLRLR